MSGVHLRLRLGRERYALPIGNVLEVSELGELSAVPGAGRAVLGVRNLRGHVLAVFDMARVLAINADASSRRIVVAEHDGTLAGLAVDEVTAVGPLTGDREVSGAELLYGAVLEDGQLVGLIDVKSLFTSLAAATA